MSHIAPDTIDSLEIYSSRIRDTSSVSRFSELKKLGLATGRLSEFSASNFAQLKVLFLRLSGTLPSGIFADSIEDLKIDNFPETDLSSLQGAINLKKLLLAGRKLETLNGLENFREMRKITVLEARSLKNISRLEELKDLREIVIGGAAKLKSIDVLSSNRELRRVEFDRCGKINSIKSLGTLSFLEELVVGEGTEILDGDLLSLLDLPRLRRFVLTPRSWYSPKPAKIRDAIALRASTHIKSHE